MMTTEEIDKIPIHFILCTERTGSSLLTLMLNMHPELMVASEEPFALYFLSKYGKKTSWSEKDLENYVDQFYALFEKNADLYFENKKVFLTHLLSYQSAMNYERLIKLTYLNFYDGQAKQKEGVRIIVDKQMKYVFHRKAIESIFPQAKFVVLSRNVMSNIQAKMRRGIDFWSHPYYQANIWINTYNKAFKFKNSEIVRFEDLQSNTENTLEQINNILGVDYNPEQLNYRNGFNRLLECRSSMLSADFKSKILNFHSGLLKPLENETNQVESNLPLVQQETIQRKTEGLNHLLAYPQSNSPTAFRPLEELRWQYYRFLAFIFRTLLWRFYFRVPLKLKLIFRRKRLKP